MRVLVISHLYPNEETPYFGSFVADQVRSLRDAGVEVMVINPKPWVPPLAKFAIPRYRFISEKLSCPREVEGVRVEPATFGAVPRNRLFWLGGPTLARSLERLPSLRDVNQTFDLVHAHGVLPSGFGAVKWGHRHGLPVVCTAHGNDINVDPHFNRLTLAETRWTIRSANAMIAVSNALQQRMLQLATPKRSRVIPSGIDHDSFPRMARSAARELLGLPPERPMLLFVGSLLPVKGVHTLIRAFARVRHEVSNANLVLVGEGPLREELHAAAIDLGIIEAVSFVGRQDRNLVRTWMAAADLLVLPSQNEGMPLVVLEAMASGLPVVASNVGGIGEALNPPAAGLLVPAGDETALSAAIVRVLNDRDFQCQLGEQGRIRSMSFTWEINARKTMALYAEILEDSIKSPHGRASSLEAA